MKQEYIDEYGIDSLPQLREAARMNAEQKEEIVFLTVCKELLEDREELEVLFNIRILSVEEAMLEMKK